MVTGLPLPPQHGDVVVAGGVAEHGVEYGDTVGPDDADSTELLDDAEENNDEERFVHFRITLDVPHVVTFPLFISPAQSQLSGSNLKNQWALLAASPHIKIPFAESELHFKTLSRLRSIPEMLEIIHDVDDILLRIIVRPEHFKKRLLSLLQLPLFNTENTNSHHQ